MLLDGLSMSHSFLFKQNSQQEGVYWLTRVGTWPEWEHRASIL